MEPNDLGGMDFHKTNLLEYSLVLVPDNPKALRMMYEKGFNPDTYKEDFLDTLAEEKGVIGYKETPKAPADEKWDAGEEVKAATVDDLKIMCAWVDSDNADTKSAYKLPHHKAEGDHAVVWNGVKAAGGAVQGARSKLDVPDADLDGIKAHLAKHYKEFDQTPPWEDDGKAIDQETTETKTTISPEMQATAEAAAKKDADDPSDDLPITDLTVGQLKDLLADAVSGDTTDEGKALSSGTVKKGLEEVLMLSDLLSTFSWVIWCFEQDQDDDADKTSLDKLNQALALILQVVQNEATMSEKSFKLSDLPKGKETIKILAKAGRAISGKHEEMLKESMDHMTKAVDGVQNVLNAATPAETNDGVDDAGKSIADDELDFVMTASIVKVVPADTEEQTEDDLYGIYAMKGGEN
jgi:hypothetical protein